MIRAGGVSLFRQEESRKLCVECGRVCTLSPDLLNHTPLDDSKAEKLVKSTGFYENGAVISVSDSSARLLTLLFTPLSPSLNVCHCERLNYVGVNKVGE